MSQESIADASKPNAGRMYDYYLGGHHNFEVDRQVADQVVKLLPWITKGARLQRWSLQDLAQELTEKRGFDVIIDFASGLPTNDHIHQVVPKGTTVIYSDYDPVVVEYAHDILKATPNVYYFQADARRPEELLNRSEVQEILHGRRDVALVHWGISVFLSDEDMAHSSRFLHDWTDKKSCWAFNAQMANADRNDPGLAQALKVYEQTGMTMRIRSLEDYVRLLQPWHADAPGFVSLVDWHGFEQSDLAQDDRKAFGPGGAGYGAYLVK